MPPGCRDVFAGGLIGYGRDRWKIIFRGTATGKEIFMVDVPSLPDRYGGIPFRWRGGDNHGTANIRARKVILRQEPVFIAALPETVSQYRCI